MTDVVVIGAGIVGAAVSYELGKYDLSIICIDKASDLSEGTTKANSGIVHAGYDCKPGTDKARFNIEGSNKYVKLSKQLDFPFRQNGSLVLAFTDANRNHLNELLEKGKKNKVSGICIIDKEKVQSLEKNINPDIIAALYAPTGGIVSPYEACCAFAETAAANGVVFRFNTAVTDIKKQDVGYSVITDKGEIFAKTIVNAAGVYSDEINNMVSEKKYSIIPRKGEYLLFDKSTKGFSNHTIFQLPTKLGKGILVTPTTHDNLIIGPSAEDIDDKTDVGTNREIMKKIVEKALMSVKSVPMDKVITSFAGLRAHLENDDDFVVGEAEGAKGFINAIGIESPGLSAAPAIAERIAEMLAEILEPKLKSTFIDRREAIIPFKSLNIEAQNNLIAKNKDFGRIICRCESITEAEIIEAIHRTPGAVTVDGVKRRVRAGGGRCQGGFCSSKIIEIIARETGVLVSDVTKCGGKSNIILK